ncbi:hypothetical protein E2C01_053700 [Portunus trituberculatus]|uniref:Uncharacterized protein n=1 Tax=Portunus trituberculatus TaxID=210409 RepID=A0A5B7GQ53_PORTR|nr:hypothetical protein [Portunus trituberculatus]
MSYRFPAAALHITVCTITPLNKFADKSHRREKNASNNTGLNVMSTSDANCLRYARPAGVALVVRVTFARMSQLIM